jgi:hypothetical protein
MGRRAPARRPSSCAFGGRARLAVAGHPRCHRTALRGGHLNLDNWRRDEWNLAVRAAGLEHRTPYAVRHFFISEAIAAGIPSYEVARLAGTSVTQIEPTYAHLFGEHLERSRPALEAFDSEANRARPTSIRNPTSHRKGPLSRASSRSGRPDSNRGPLVPQGRALWQPWGQMTQPCGFASR